jgi:hypothetical protein
MQQWIAQLQALPLQVSEFIHVPPCDHKVAHYELKNLLRQLLQLGCYTAACAPL